MSIIANFFEGITNTIAKVLFADVLFFTPNAKLPFIIFWVMLACLFFMIKLDFINFRRFIQSFKIFLEKEKQDKSGKTITSRSAFLGSISGCVGVGSVSGVVASIYYGGPGVVIWLLIAAFCAMPLRFAEVYLGHYFRKKDKDGNIVEYGPFAYIKNGLREMGYGKIAKVLVFVFAAGLLLTSISAIMSQISPTTELISKSFFDGSDVASFIIAILLATFTLAVIFGGLSRISKVIEKLAVSMSLLYILIIICILGFNYKNIIPSIILIWNSAFELKSIYGGVLGTAIIAFTRIISMNEVGLGTVAILHGKSKNENSTKEAMLAMSGPFIAILIFVALNSFAVIASGSYLSGKNGVIMINDMFASVSPILSFALIVVMLLFAITTLIAWYFYVETALLEFKGGKILVKLYPFFFFTLIVCSAFIPFEVMLQVIDVIGITIIIPNVIVLVMLSRKVKEGLNDY
jgi:AGCS family alanine or glycine:cation symporter